MSSHSFVDVLSALMSGNNQIRKEAEIFFSEVMLEKDLEATISNLMNEMSTKEQDLVLRSFCGVLLRRIFDRSAKYAERISKERTAEIRSKLLTIWASEQNSLLLRRLSHIIAQCAAGGQWIDLLPLTISHEVELTDDGKVSLLSLIETIAEYCPEDILTHIQTLCAFLSKYIASSNVKIQVACARTTAACIAAADDDNARNAFKPALQLIIDILGATLSRGEEADATSIMENLVDVAEVQPLFFKGVLENVVNAMLTVAASTTLEFPTRSIALELLITISETAPALARRCQPLVQGIVPLSMSIMLEVEVEDEEWARGEYGEDAVEENYVVGEEAVERVAAGLGGRVVAPLMFAAVEQAAANADWKYRRAAVSALGRLAEGCTEVFGGHLDAAQTFLCAALRDSSNMVQYEAVQAIGRIATLFSERLDAMVPQFVPLLTSLLVSSSVCNRVRGHAASALINLANPEACSTELLSPFVDPLLAALVTCLQAAPLSVQSPCMSLLGCVAQVAEDGFAPYYQAFMPGLKLILRSATAPHLAELRGKAMETAGLIGEAVGEETFQADALEIMQLLLSALEQGDGAFEYVLPACARVAKALGPKFEPFLPLVIAPVLAGAAQQIQFSMEDADEGDEEGEVVQDEESGAQTAVISLGAGVRKRVTLNTHAVQQKNQCARILYELAGSLKGHLRSYLAPSLQALLPMVTDKHSSEIRASAALALSKVFSAYLDAFQLGIIPVTDAQAALRTVLGELLKSIAGDVNSTSRACAAESIRDVLVCCYESGEETVDGCYKNPVVSLDMDSSLELTGQLLVRCSESITRRQERVAAIAQNEGLDDEDKDACAVELEDEDDLLTNYADALGHLLKIHGEAFMPTFEKMVVPAISPFLMPNQPESLQVLAVCTVDDMVEFGGSAALKYIPQSLPTLLRNLASTHSVLRQSSSYGVAQIAKKAPNMLADHLDGTVRLLLALINSPAAREDDNEGITENALFALGFILTSPYFRTTPWWISSENAIADWVNLWLRNLPLRADNQEAKTSNRLICDALEGGDVVVMGDKNANIPQLFRIIAEVLGSAPLCDNSSLPTFDSSKNPIAHSTTHVRMEKLAEQLFACMSGEVVTAVLEPLTAELKNTLLRFKR